ncbi:hypothetical protein HUU62_03090 [Rhodoferax sp. 4810]|uniref:Uncharacterized protein n=1 Tax=Thiospirillum jenense TaxID=1653858 RepID=A0A839H8M9_9GAMM|nr:hypothetical protein [Thiospirillum jenense]MBB1073400.1 hypothetical protein [Rhodoferax jenense]MBB1125753.1 hypothetical protein [Thiospirillum jenense]
MSQLNQFDLMPTTLADLAADSVGRMAEHTALETHLLTLEEQYQQLGRSCANAMAYAELELQIARVLVNLERGEKAWSLGRAAFEQFMAVQAFESAVDCCDVLFRANQPDSLCALGQGIWLAVTYPIDPELAIELLTHVIEETPDDADGAAVAATTALFLADMRATDNDRENLLFFTSRLLGTVAYRHSHITTQAAFDHWRDQLELREPQHFLGRLRNIIDVLVQDDWWFDRTALQAQLPLN